MESYTIGNTTATADTLDAAKRAAVVGYLRNTAGVEPTGQEIDALLVEVEAREAELLDLAGLKDKIAAEIGWSQVARTQIDTATLEQLRTTLKHLVIGYEWQLKAWQFVIRKFITPG